MLDIVFRNLTGDKSYSEDFFIKIIETSVSVLSIKNNLELSINIVDESKIKELNGRYRNKDKSTDVLSFPLEGESKDAKLLGDIFICPAVAKKDAKEENIDTNKKLAHLTVHGFLHLLGYDHESSEVEANLMQSLEDKILEQFKSENNI